MHGKTGLDGADFTGNIAESDEMAAPAKAVDRPFEGVPADGIVYRMDARAIGNLAHPFGEIFPPVIDRMIATTGARDFCLLLAADGADNGGAEIFRPLA